MLTLLKNVFCQVGMKHGWQCDFEEETLCGAVNQVESDNSDWEWVNGGEGGKFLFYLCYFLVCVQ